MSGNPDDEEFDPDDLGFDFDPKTDDKKWPIKATPADLAIPDSKTDQMDPMTQMTGNANLGLEYVQSLNPNLSKRGVGWIDKTLNAAYPLDVTFAAPTGNSIIQDVAHLKAQYNPSNEELTQKQNMQIINAGLDVLREQNPPKLPVKASARPLSKVSYMKPPKPPKYTRGGASRKMRKSKKTKKSRKMRRVKTQMRRKNSSRKSTRRRTRK
jgi:hypothetical protein